MIPGDANHFGIAAIPGNRGNGQFDGHWLAIVMKHVGMSKIGWLTRQTYLRQNDFSGWLLTLYMLEESDVRWHSIGQSFSCECYTCVFPKPASKAGDPPCAKVGSRLDAFLNRPTTSTISRTRLRLECSL
ncbi:uncharacterized protein TNCV_2368991 [Trichonephila clavipes]|nr:uncharacterized protein TNCV_2368991 [Trichonephila clavipes]